ncbi:MAG: hypothetical protein ABR562_04055 [Thermoplasmatota archaeon]|nr:hypothetical protein [Halobacteriales archaeon]
MHAVRYAGLVAVALLLSQAAYVNAEATLALTAPDSTPVAQGGNASIAIKVHLQVGKILCQGTPPSGPASATVHLAVSEPSMTGISHTFPSTVTFAIAAPNQYANSDWNADGSQDKTVYLNVSVAKGTIPNHEHPMNITATFDGATSDLTNCTVVPGGQISYKASNSASAKVVTGAGAGPVGNMTGGGVSGSLSGTSKASFSLPLAVEVGMLVAIGMFVSRRKQA